MIAQHGAELVQKLRATQGSSIEVTNYLFACILDAIVGREIVLIIRNKH